MAAAMLVATTGCGSSSAAKATATASSSEQQPSSTTGSAVATSLADIKAKGELIIGLDATFAPMGFRETNGDLVGFDIDLAVAVCDVLGVTPKFQPIDWSAKEMELNGGNIDCIWNGMSATDERKVSMSLSQEYLNNKIVIIGEGADEISAKKDLANFKIGIQMGSAALEVVMADSDYESFKDKIVEYPTYDEVILDMQAGGVNCMIVDEVLGSYKNAKLNNKYKIAPIDFGDDLYAIGFRKSDTELTDAVNKALQSLIANGKAADISTKWFGSDIVIK